MEELLKELILEQKKTREEQEKTNELLMYSNQGKDPFELLTAKQIAEEFDIGLNTVLKQFKDPELSVQIYTHPMKVARRVYQEYFKERHDYLSRK